MAVVKNKLKERWVEARHAGNKRNIASAHNIGPAFVGFLSVLPKLRDLVCKGDLVELASLCERTCTMSRLFTHMRLNNHPQTIRIHNERATHSVNPEPGDYRFAREFNRRGYKDLVKVLFHTDRQTLHGAVGDLDEPDLAYPDPGDAIDDDGDDGGPPPGPGPGPASCGGSPFLGGGNGGGDADGGGDHNSDKPDGGGDSGGGGNGGGGGDGGGGGGGCPGKDVQTCLCHGSLLLDAPTRVALRCLEAH